MRNNEDGAPPWEPSPAELFFGEFRDTRRPSNRIAPFLRRKRFFTSPERKVEIQFFFLCRCGRRAYYDPNLDPNRLICQGCGARNPELKQEMV